MPSAHILMQYVKQAEKQQMENAHKEASIYMRFHVTLEKAMHLIHKIYKDKALPNTHIPLIDHALEIAGLTEEIQTQDYLDYHLTWLTGVLKDLFTTNPVEYITAIEEVLEELRVEESQRVQHYIRQLSSDRDLPLGQQCRAMVERVNEMDAIPCYIQIFQLYTHCCLWKRLHWEKSKTEYEGYMSYAYMFFYKAVLKHIPVGKNLKPEIKTFFKNLGDQMGGINGARAKADLFYKS